MKFNSFEKWSAFIVAFLLCFLPPGLVKAQSMANYAFSSTTSGSLEDLTVNSTSLLTGLFDSENTDVTPIGFDFSFMGVNYSHFSANSNGQFLFHNSNTETAITSYSVNGPAANRPYLLVMAGDNEIKNGIRYTVSGTAPNRKFILEWSGFYAHYIDITTTGDMQLWLHEGTGVIEYVYGSIYNSSSSAIDRSIGLSSSNTATTAGFVTIGATPTFNLSATFTTNTFAGSALIANLGSLDQGSRRTFSFSPTAQTAPTNLTFVNVGGTLMTLNWVDNATDEVGYKIYSSLDGVNYTLRSTQPANTTSFTANSLNFATLYHWKVVAYREIESASVNGSQSTLAASFAGGVKTVGSGGDFENLTTAFAYINNNGLTGDVELQLITGYPAAPEIYPILSCDKVSTATFNVKVYPTVSGLSITSANATGTLNLNGAENVIFDGRINQTGVSALEISNTDVGYAVQFVNDASHNTLQYLTINSGNTAATSGTIVFAGSNKVTGNDNNLIDNCSIGKITTTTPRFGIFSAGASVAIDNSGNTVSNSSIHDYFSATASSAGVFLSSNSSAWTFNSNKLYQTETRTVTTGSTHRGIHINTTNGTGYVVTNNTIGFGSNTGTGQTSYSGTAVRFVGLEMSTLSSDLAIPTSVQGNTIGGINVTSTTGTTSAPGLFAGIYNSSGRITIGDVAGNTIGTGGINLAITASTNGSAYGIYCATSGQSIVKNNNVGAITLTSGVATVACNVFGIYVSGGTLATVENNIVGGSPANAIKAGTAGVTTATSAISGIETGSITNLVVDGNLISNLENSAFNGNVSGIKAATSIYTINNNVVRDLSLNASSGASSSNIYGFYDHSSPTVETITNNKFFNFTIQGSGTSNSSLISGISSNSTSSIKNISSNLIHDFTFSNSSTGTVTINGINNQLGATTEIFKNKIYNLTANGEGSIVNGILIASTSSNGVLIAHNNLISKLKTPTGTSTTVDNVRGISVTSSTLTSKINLYYNTIYLDATSTGANFSTAGIFHTANAIATTAALDLKNNIIINESTANGTGITSALRRSSTNIPNFASTSNRNLLYAGVPSASRVILYDGTTSYQTLQAYKTALAPREVNSHTGEATFITAGYATADNFFISLDPTNIDFLRPKAGITSVVESGGENITTPSIAFDYVGSIRAGNTGYTGAGTAPDLGAYEFEGVVATPTITINSIVPGLTPQCNATARLITAEILPSSGTIVSAIISYSVNGVPQSDISMVNTSGDIFEGTIPVVSPENATVTWRISVQNSNAIGNTYNGTAYADNVLFGSTSEIVASNTTICGGTSISLEAKVFKPLDVTVGTGTTASSSGAANSPFYGGYGASKVQYLIRANELVALGVQSGTSIEKLSVHVTTAGDAIADYSISMGHTTVNAMTNEIFDVPTLVYNTPLFTPVIGQNTFNLSSPFVWDGVSNLIISICYSDNSTGFTTSAVRATATGFTSGFARVVDNVSASTMCAYTGTTSSFATTTTGSTSNRPNFRFEGKLVLPISTITWNDGVSNISTSNPITVTPLVTTTYTADIVSNGCALNPVLTKTIDVNAVPTTLTATNSAQCGSHIPSASVTSTSGLPTPTINWYAAATGGSALQSGQYTTYLTVISTTTTFYVSEMNSVTGCESDRVPVTVTVAMPDPIVVEASAQACLGQSFDIEIANGNPTPFQSYSYSTISTTGSGLTTAASGAIVSVLPTEFGTYTYEVTATDNGCSMIGSVTVTVNPSPTNTIANVNDATICIGESVDLSSSAVSNLDFLETYNQDFAASSLPSDWTFVNNGNGSSWSRESISTAGTGSLTYEYDEYFAADAWAFSPQLQMVAGETYTISFMYRVGLSSFEENLKVTIGSQQMVASHSTVLWDNNGASYLSNATWMQGVITYTPTVSGAYSVGFNCYSEADSYNLHVDDVSIQYSEESPVTYSWSSNPVGFTSTAQNPAGVAPTENTTYTITATSVNGCSETASVAVVVNQPSTSTTVVEECESYSWNGTTYTASGAYTFTTTNSNGCDSTATLNLTIKESTASTVAISECSTYTWPLNGQVYTTSGNYIHTIPNAVGCDSVITLALTILEPTTSNVHISACDSYTWPLNGQLYTASGTHTHVIPNAAGCDSTITLDLVISTATTSSVTVEECVSYTWPLNGITYFASEVVTYVGTSVAGCDSTVTLNLTINQPTSGSITLTACDSYTWPLNDQTYTASGAYTHVIDNAAGCDSTITLNLTINASSASTVSMTACDSYEWALNGQTYTASGAYTHVLENAAGCDSTVTLNLTIEMLTATATNTGDAMITASAGTSFQWIDCATNSPIVGETSQVFTATVNGSYAVIISNGSCTDTSACVEIGHLSIKDVMTSTIALFPNPTAGNVKITMDAQEGVAEVMDMNGKLLQTIVVHSGDIIRLGHYDRGVYSIKIKTEFGSVVERIIKN